MPARRHRKSHDTSVPTDSLSDVAFLLIIFFILTTSMQRLSGVTSELPSAQHTEQVKTTDKTPSIKLRDGALSLDDQAVTPEELRSRLAALNFASRAEAERVVVFEATGHVNYQQYYEVMAAVSSAGGILGIMSETTGGRP